MTPRAFALAAALLAFACTRETPRVDPATGELRAGQVWRYRTRPGEAGSRLTILKVEDDAKFGRVVHTRFDRLRVINRAGNVSGSVLHVPFREASLRPALVELSGTAEASLDAASEARWKANVAAGRAEPWSKPPEEVLAHIEKEMQK